MNDKFIYRWIYICHVIEFKLSIWKVVTNLKVVGNLTLLFHYSTFWKHNFSHFKNQSIYFDEPNPARAKGSSPEGLPDWVMGELGTSEHKLNESWKLSSGEDSSLVQSPTDVHRYAMKMKFWFFYHHLGCLWPLFFWNSFFF